MAGEQPPNIEAFLQHGNAASRNPLEQTATDKLHGDAKNTSIAAAKGAAGASKPQDGVPTSRGLGVIGSEPVDELEARNTHIGNPEKQLENDSVNAEQMATLAEGKVADAVDTKSGTQQVPGQGPAEEQDFASDLDRKKAEQASAREEVKAAKQGGADVGGGGQTRALGNESLADA